MIGEITGSKKRWCSVGCHCQQSVRNRRNRAFFSMSDTLLCFIDLFFLRSTTPHTGFVSYSLLFLFTQRTALLQSQLATTDSGGRTVLQLAALSGSHDAFTAVLDACKKSSLEQNQVHKCNPHIYGWPQGKRVEHRQYIRGKCSFSCAEAGGHCQLLSAVVFTQILKYLESCKYINVKYLACGRRYTRNTTKSVGRHTWKRFRLQCCGIFPPACPVHVSKER